MKRFFLLAFLLVAAGVSAQPQLRIGTISIRNLDIYTPQEAERGFVYRTADRLHYETRKSVISQFLLFREGDSYRPELLAETERNLRALRFLKSASVTASEPHDGVVDVVVTTQDAWSITPETQSGRGGGSTSLGLNLTDTNVGGYGKDLSVGWNKDVDRTSRNISYADPSFFAPYWNGRFVYGSNSDGYDHRFSIGRPFYSFATPWAVNASFNGMLREDKLYQDGREAMAFRQHHRFWATSYGVALDPNDFSASRLTVGIRLVDDTFLTLARGTAPGLPASRAFHYMFARYDYVDNDFMKLNYVNKDMRYEDFNLGRQLSFEAAFSPGPRDTTGFARASAGRGWRVSENGFVIPNLSVETRIDGGLQNGIATSSILYVHRTDDHWPRAFVAHAAVASSWRPDGDLQYAIDGSDGLRGYRLHSFTGTRSFLVNVEERLFVGRELLQLVSPGFVVFADAGNATNGGFTKLMSVKSDVGFGFRLGLPRTPKNLLRLDFAYPLNADPFGRKGWLVSFASGQAF